ncbi:cupin-like domain-containing protein [Alteromonadaceae bacterium BrNp21-10]|nr:cupin-like domain-containing protein [Alteromonadaceae bacterium BrNp21-10]
MNNVQVLEGVSPQAIPFDDLFAQQQPVILRDLVKEWPLVQAAKGVALEAMALLEQHDSGRPLLVYKGAPAIKARFAYNDSCTGFNFKSEKSTIAAAFAHIREQLAQEEHDYLYINSLKFNDGFPELSRQHQLNFNHPEFENNQPVAKIWLGTESIAAAHFDQPKNLACCVQGKRRFTLFAPDQVHNLYPGPLSPTPGGQVVTMADLNAPDFEKFPRLQQALDNAYIADLEPGDALYYPSMWWHQVQAYDRFNIMVNFWWMAAEPHLGNPMDALMHCMLSVRDRPLAEQQAWRELFNYYIFDDAQQVRQHLPVESQGALAPMDDTMARRMRSLLLNNLNR